MRDTRMKEIHSELATALQLMDVGEYDVWDNVEKAFNICCEMLGCEPTYSDEE